MNKPECVIHSDGTISWYLNGKFHREDGPACEHPNGTKKWFLNGKHHREDGPAVEYASGTKNPKNVPKVLSQRRIDNRRNPRRQRYDGQSRKAWRQPADRHADRYQ